MEGLVWDVRYALRALSKERGITLVILLTLGLGIGLNVTVQALTRSFLFRPLPFPERLVLVVSTLPKLGWTSEKVSIPEMGDVRERSRLLEPVAIFVTEARPTLLSRGTPERLFANFVTSPYFSLLEAKPLLGRTFLSEEDVGIGGHPVVILSHGFWRRRFGGDPQIVGSKINLTGQIFTVVGVMPADFQDVRNDYDKTDVWLPLSMGVPFYDTDMFESRRARRYVGLARLKEGVSLRQAQEEADGIARQLAVEYPYENRDTGLRLVELYEWYFAGVDGPAKVLVTGAVLVLLLCCVNIATLRLVRVRSRLPQIAVGFALGAGRGRLVRQILLESFILAALGGGLGILIAWWATKVLQTLGGMDLPPFAEIRFDSGLIWLSLALVFATGLLFGLLPAWRLTTTNLRESLQARGRRVASKRGPRQLHLIALAEVAFSAFLLVGAGLTVKSLFRLTQTDIGFDTQNLLTMQTELGGAKYQNMDFLRTFSRQLLEELEALPGVDAVVFWGPDMIGRARSYARISPAEMSPDDPQGRVMARRMRVTPGALKATGITLLKGRDFGYEDSSLGPPIAAIVDERIAERFWPGEDAVGKRFYRGSDVNYDGVVIGVTATVLHSGRAWDERQEVGDIYYPFLAAPLPEMSILIRSERAPEGLLADVRRILARHDPEIALFDIATMEERLARGEAGPRLNTLLLTLYGLLAMLLATLGVYGVLAHMVQQRTPELAIRSTFGASRRNLLWVVMRPGMFSAILGAAIGLLAAAWLSKYIESLLFQVSRLDSSMYLGVGVLLALAAFVACYVPARRAGAVDPLEVLRAAE